MSHLLSLENVSLAYGLDQLLNQVNLQINTGERISLIGRNGAGKSSLLKLIEGSELPDSGTIWRKPGIRLARLEQTLPSDYEQSVFDYVALGLHDIGSLLAEYHHLIQEVSVSADVDKLKKLEILQAKIDVCHGWQYEAKINAMLERLQLNSDQTVSSLSGGWQRRAALAKAWVTEPDLLLLDEPTNHLDIAGIEWLEDTLREWQGALVFITHDRALLKRLATRIIELDRGNITSWPGDYTNFLQQKAALLHAEEKLHADFDKKLAQEEIWIRQGIKARRTRNEGRVRALEKMRRDRLQRRTVQGNVKMTLNEAERSGHVVIEADDISQEYNNKKVIDHLSIRIQRGDRIGLIGQNGAGKTTLLNILLGKIKPQKGVVTQGTRLEIAYFDQLRATLDWNESGINNVAEGSDYIEINGKQRHIISYLSDFLFTPDRARMPIKALSGGECNRLLLAKLFSKSSNLLVMDEPTNDLDIETLELLEEMLLQYQGTLLLVSHDREFLDHVVTSTLVFESDGRIQEYVGGYHDWVQQRKTIVEKKTSQNRKTDEKRQEKSLTTIKLSYKEQRELNELPERIQTMEKELSELQILTSSADFYKKSDTDITSTMNRMAELTKMIETAYQRWQELE